MSQPSDHNADSVNSMIIGLTGGIGSGKTVASDHFASLGVPVIDTDVIARQIVQAGQPALAQLVEVFGSSILLSDATLDRARLRELAFKNTQSKATLDAITHPAIRDETLRQIKAVHYPYCIVVVPLLSADSPFLEIMHRVIAVTCDADTRTQRVMQRSQLSRAEVQRIMATQLSDEQRVAFADDVIANDGSLEAVHRAVEKLHECYLSLANHDHESA